MSYSILYTGGNKVSGTLIERFTGDDASHCAIAPNTKEVWDATFIHGVKRWDREEWFSHRTVVQEHQLVPASPAHEADSWEYLESMEGLKYDTLEILGFLLWRDLGSASRPVCSSFGRVWTTKLTGKAWPGRTGRTAPRHLRLFTAGMQPPVSS